MDHARFTRARRQNNSHSQSVIQSVSHSVSQSVIHAFGSLGCNDLQQNGRDRQREGMNYTMSWKAHTARTHTHTHSHTHTPTYPNRSPSLTPVPFTRKPRRCCDVTLRSPGPHQPCSSSNATSDSSQRAGSSPGAQTFQKKQKITTPPNTKESAISHLSKMENKLATKSTENDRCTRTHKHTRARTERKMGTHAQTSTHTHTHTNTHA